MAKRRRLSRESAYEAGTEEAIYRGQQKSMGRELSPRDITHRDAALNALFSTPAFIPKQTVRNLPKGLSNTNGVVANPRQGDLAKYLGPPKSTKAGGIVSAAIAAGAGIQQINDMTGGKLAETAGKAAGKMVERVKRARTSTTQQPPARTTTTTTSTTTTSSRGGSNYQPSGRGGSYLMNCDKPNSKKINLETGIRSGLIVNEGEPMNRLDFSPLFIMGGDLLREDNIATSFKEYINTIIYPTVSTAVQFTLNYAYELQLADFTKWFYQMTKCLQLYYTLDSIIVYCDDRNNTNQGLRYLRTKISSQIRLKVNLLRDLLGKQPIPANVLNYVRFMSQNYKFSELPGAPIYRLAPGNIFNDYAGVGTGDSYKDRLSETMLQKCIDDLISYSPVYNKIYQAMPSWHIANSCLPPSCIEPYYDEGFRTFWFNSSLTYKASLTGSTIYTRQSTTGFRYWLYTNFLDGVFYASCSFCKTGQAGTLPGIYDPTADFSSITEARGWSNALAYYAVDGVGNMYPVSAPFGDTSYRLSLQFDNYSVPLTQDNSGGQATWTTINNLDGSCQVAQECTFETWKQAVYLVTRWLFL